MGRPVLPEGEPMPNTPLPSFLLTLSAFFTVPRVPAAERSGVLQSRHPTFVASDRGSACTAPTRETVEGGAMDSH